MGAAAVAALGATLIGAPAQANDAGVCSKAWSTYKACAASAQWEDNNDSFYLYDNEADGAGVRVLWSKNGVGQTPLHHNGGNGTYSRFQFSSPKGTIMQFQVCIEKNNVTPVETCSGKIVGTAG